MGGRARDWLHAGVGPGGAGWCRARSAAPWDERAAGCLVKWGRGAQGRSTYGGHRQSARGWVRDAAGLVVGRREDGARGRRVRVDESRGGVGGWAAAG